MYICMTEEQKNSIVKHVNIMLVEYKRLIRRIIEAMKSLIIRIKQCACEMEIFREAFLHMSPREKYRTMRRLNKRGYTEKEINQMMYGVYHCRNNC